ncbi:uncharacterized protein [Diadema antillarum]|uniref:uncharacterized protein n=1 Tax=Diadema antillarum TaxID=105358 RepID=UPI003A8A1432
MILVTLSVAWLTHYWKRRPEDSSRSTTHTLHSINTNACTVHRRVPDHPRIQTRDATAHQEGVNHIYQNSTMDHPLRVGMANNLGNPSPLNFISRPLYDLLHYDGEDTANEDTTNCQNTSANAKIEHYMDMSGTVEKKKVNVKFLRSGDTSATEKDVDENGYLISNVSLLSATNNGPPRRYARTKTCNIDNVQSCEETIIRSISIPSTAAGNSVRCGDFQGSVYEDILSTSDQSAPIRESPREHEYSTIERNNTRDPLAIGLKNPLNSVSIYSSKQRQEPEVDENGYLVLEAYDGEIVEDRYVNMDKVQPSTTYLYENEI